jgi:hypothetical protein
MAVFLTAARYKEKYHTCPAGFVRENSTCGGIYKVRTSLNSGTDRSHSIFSL